VKLIKFHKVGGTFRRGGRSTFEEHLLVDQSAEAREGERQGVARACPRTSSGFRLEGLGFRIWVSILGFRFKV